MTISPKQRRAAEERVFAQYEAELMATTALAEEPAHEAYEPVWPLADGRVRVTELSLGIFVEQAQLERAYPDTVASFTFRFWRRPECLFATDRPIWTLETLGEPEPRFDGFFTVHLMEDIARWLGPELDMCTADDVIDFARSEGWSASLPRIASGEIRSSPRDQELAARALELSGSSRSPTAASCSRRCW